MCCFKAGKVLRAFVAAARVVKTEHELNRHACPLGGVKPRATCEAKSSAATTAVLIIRKTSRFVGSTADEGGHDSGSVSRYKISGMSRVSKIAEFPGQSVANYLRWLWRGWHPLAGGNLIKFWNSDRVSMALSDPYIDDIRVLLRPSCRNIALYKVH